VVLQANLDFIDLINFLVLTSALFVLSPIMIRV